MLKPPVFPSVNLCCFPRSGHDAEFDYRSLVRDFGVFTTYVSKDKVKRAWGLVLCRTVK